MEDKNEERTDFIGGNVIYAIVFTLLYAIVFALFSFGYVFTAVVFPEGLNIPLSVLVIMAMMMRGSK